MPSLEQLFTLPLKDAEALLAEAEETAEFLRGYIALAKKRTRWEANHFVATEAPLAPESPEPPADFQRKNVWEEIDAVMQSKPVGYEWTRAEIAALLPHRAANTVMNRLLNKRDAKLVKQPRKGVWVLPQAEEAS